MASVTKRGNKWSVRYRTTDDQGITIHHRVSFNTKEEAWENARLLEAASGAGVNVHGDNMTCGELMEKWYSEHCVYLEPNTKIRYSQGIDRLSETFIYETKVKKLNKGMHAAVIDLIMQGDDTHAPVAAITAKTTTDPLRYSVSWAFKNGLILRNPLENVKLPKIPKRQQRVLNEADIQDIIKESSANFRIPLLLAIYGGLRRGECAGLRWSDVDFKRNTLTINVSSIRLRNGVDLEKDSPKNESSRRTISMPKFVMQELASVPKPREQVCVSSTGEPYKLLSYPNYLSQIIDRINSRRSKEGIAPIPKATFHDLRHTHAAMLIKMGIQPKVISERFGHTSISITMDVYGYLMEGLQSGVADALDKEFQEQTSGRKNGHTDPEMGTKTVGKSSSMKKEKTPEPK